MQKLTVYVYFGENIVSCHTQNCAQPTQNLPFASATK